MDGLINAIVTAIERLLIAVNTGKKMFTLTLLVLILIASYLAYQLSHSQDIISEFRSPRIERVSGWCYQQVLPSLRGDRRIVAVQFPVPDYLIKLGVKENITAFVFEDQISQPDFDKLCSGLIDELFDPQAKIKLLRSNPEWKKKLQDFYMNLDAPAAQEPLKKSDTEVKK